MAPDSLSGLRRAIREHGPLFAWKHIDDFVTGDCYQSEALLNSSEPTEAIFGIRGMFRPTPYFKTSQLMVVIGNAPIQLGVLAPTPVGSGSLQDLFSTPGDQTHKPESLSLLDIQHALRTWGVEPLASDLYTVTLTQLNGVRCVCWKTGTKEFYKEERLIETKAGQALLEAPATANRRTRVSQYYLAAK